LQGGDGGSGSTTASGGTQGGSSYFGGGGRGAVIATGCQAGVAPGSGGGGNSISGNGCDGAEGLVIVWEYSGTAGSDYAEYYETDGSASAGDLVGMGDEMFEYTTEDGVQRMAILEKASPENRLVGVVSTAPGQLIGKEIRDFAKNPRPIALTGRVPTKVSNMNGAIKKGDLLSASTIPGVAMKSTKAGQIIGSAMEDYNGAEGEIGKITVFVNTGYSTGARTKDLLAKQGVNLEENVLDMGTVIDVDKVLLAQALEQKKDIRADIPVSEIFTDRVVAGLSIVAPKVTTQELAADVITPSLTNTLAIQLGPDGSVTFGEAGKEPTSTIDALGNATFAGTLTAKTIRADSIEGLEIYTDSVKSLEEKYAGLVPSSFVATNPTAPLVPPTTETTADVSPQTLEKFSAKNLAVTLDANILGKLSVSGALTIGGNAEFAGETIFQKVATFFSDTLFKGKVMFEKAPIFSSNTAGFAIIKKGEKEVRVSFENAYEKQPIVTISLTNDISPLLDDKADDSLKADVAAVEQDYIDTVFASDMKYIVTKKSEDGFTIIISGKAPADIQFSWVALAVNNPHTFESELQSKNKEETINEEVVNIEESAPLPIETTPSTDTQALETPSADTQAVETPSVPASSGSGEITPLTSEESTAAPIASEVQ
jgi:hypothetical protein